MDLTELFAFQEFRLGSNVRQAARRYFFLCPDKHAFTSRLSGADAICKRCRDHRVKYSVASIGYEEPWPTLTEVGPQLRFQDEQQNHIRSLMVRVDPNALDLRRTFVALAESFKQKSLQALIQVCHNTIDDLALDGAGEGPTRSGSINQIASRSGGMSRRIAGLKFADGSWWRFNGMVDITY